jgi:putative hydrolase of the HAD superfamily
MNQDSPAVQLVVFDIGGVLVRIVPWDEAHLACGYEEQRMPPREAFLAEMSRLNHAYDSGVLQPDAYEEAAIRAAGARYTLEEVRLIHASQLLEERPGIGAVFDALDEANLGIGLLSNTNPVHWERLTAAAEATQYPTLLRARHRLASFMAGCAKPEARIYEEFARLAGSKPAEILFFDDLERNVTGAKAAGWRAELVYPREDVAEQLFAGLRRHGVLGE